MISFIIPVYNKGTVLFKTLKSLITHLKNSSLADYEIIVVNDGSTDNSFAEAVRFKKFNGETRKIKIFHYTRNIGKGFALRFGFSQCLGDPVVFLDGDMDINTKQVIQALAKFDSQRPDVLIGSKYLPQSRVFYPMNRYLYSLILRKIIHLLFHLNVSDTQVGLKIFNRRVLQTVFPRLIIKRFAVDLEILIVAQMFKFSRIVEMPIIIKHTSANRSTIDLWAVKNFCQDIAAIWFRKNILRYYEQNNEESLTPLMVIRTA